MLLLENGVKQGDLGGVDDVAPVTIYGLLYRLV
jgi:hypothetical protein